MIIDGHAHVTREGYGNAELLRRRMRETGIDRTVLVPGGMIDVRRMSAYVTGAAQPNTTSIPNDVVEQLIREDPVHFAGFYCVNPGVGMACVEDFRAALGRGFHGLKLAPIVHRFRLDLPSVKELALTCAEFGVPFYSHVIADAGASTEKMGELAAEFKETLFIIGHMGLGPADTLAVDVAAKYDNVLLETSGGSFLGIQSALARLGASKLIYGSEFPLHHQSVELHKLELLVKDSDFELVAGGNMLRLLHARANGAGVYSPLVDQLICGA